MNIVWNTGRPKDNGEYIVVLKTARGLVMQVPFTTQHGWNTSVFGDNKNAFADEEVVAWAKPFGKAVLDIYGFRR